MIPKAARILVVDDDEDVLLAMKMLLKTEVKQVVTEKNPERLLSILSKEEFDVILLDMNYKSAIHTGNEGFFWLSKIMETAPNTAVIMITAYGDIDTAVRSLKEGASDFVVKPWSNEKLLQTIAEAYNKKKSKPEPQKTSAAKPVFETTNLGFSEIIGNSVAMQEVFRKIEKVAPTDANVLILGENGTGKELIAKALHSRSNRSKHPFISVDLGSLTDTLFESELFGHKKGAFTDAREDRTGRFEAANGGTIFLDEIGNVNLAQQAKLLSALQNRQVTKVGSNSAVNIDIRLICATNMPLHQMATEGKFRQDLVYRINTVEIILPPLRQREDDIILLAKHFLSVYSKKYKKEITGFETAALAKLKKYAWPGNVRELQHTIERAIIMADQITIQATDLAIASNESQFQTTITSDTTFKLDELEKNTILKVIEKHQGNITKAARELGLTRTALYRRIDKYDI